MPHVILARLDNTWKSIAFADGTPHAINSFDDWRAFANAHRGSTMFGVDVTFTMEPEEDSPMSHLGAKEDIDWVRAELAKGNDWAWFCAKVEGKRGDDTETEYLGTCSYRSREEWFSLDGYWPDMVRNVAEQLQARFVASFGTFEVI